MAEEVSEVGAGRVSLWGTACKLKEQVTTKMDIVMFDGKWNHGVTEVLQRHVQGLVGRKRGRAPIMKHGSSASVRAFATSISGLGSVQSGEVANWGSRGERIIGLGNTNNEPNNYFVRNNRPSTGSALSC